MKPIWILLLIAFVPACRQKITGIDPRVLTLPAFNLQLLDGVGIFNTGNIKKGKPTILINFAPDCEACSYQTEQLITHISLVSSCNIYLCSSYPLQSILAYTKHYGLNRFENITVARDKDFFFDQQLKIPATPWLFIYAANKKLKKIITGPTDIRTLLQFIK